MTCILEEVKYHVLELKMLISVFGFELIKINERSVGFIGGYLKFKILASLWRF